MAQINQFEVNSVFLSEISLKKTEKSETLIEESKIFSESEVDRIIQMAWEDRTPFEAIELQFGLKEKEVIEFMRANSKLSSFKMWRKRMTTRKTKHQALRNASVDRFKCSMQRSTGNRIAKR